VRRWVLATASLAIVATAVTGATPKQGNADWPSYGLTADESRFSPLTQINADTVKNLGLAWSIDLPVTARGLQGTPLMVGRTLYFTTSMAIVYAVDAATGRQLWTYDPEGGLHNPAAMRTSLGVNRGLAYSDGAIFVGSVDGRLISLDARTGKANWIVDTFDDPDAHKTITGAPRVFNGKVIIGSAGGDFGQRASVSAFDAKTGRRVWRFYIVPGDPAKGFEDQAQAMAAKTWSGEWWRWGGGGDAWNGFTFDAELNRIYIGTGNAGPYNPRLRSPGGGDNLFIASIVALDADTGKYVWHYQLNPSESWDYKATADMIVADLEIAGKPRKVLMQAPTNGFFYVLDRLTGKVISAEKLGKVTWAERIDLATGRPIEAPGIRYENGPVTFWPSPQGVHNWHAMSFNPQMGLVYIPTLKLAGFYDATAEDVEGARKWMEKGGKSWRWPAFGARYGKRKIDPDDGTGELVAWDPVAQKKRWSVPTPYGWGGGTLTTRSNLVFQGTADGWLHAYDGATGHELWKYYVNQGIIAPPITYAVGGAQYVTVLAGYLNLQPQSGDAGWRWGKHAPRVVTFKLGGTARLSTMPGPDRSVDAIDDPAQAIDPVNATRGQALFGMNCASCHGGGAQSLGIGAPDLRESQVARDFDAFRTVVHEGALATVGMPKFDELSDDELRQIQMYIWQVSRAAKSGETIKHHPDVRM